MTAEPGAAMAGMLVPGLSVLPENAWAVVFGIAVAWLGWHAARSGVAGLCDQSPVQQLIIVAPTLIAIFPRLDGGSPNRPGSPEMSTRRTL
jgi:hypothetical protein